MRGYRILLDGNLRAHRVRRQGMPQGQPDHPPPEVDDNHTEHPILNLPRCGRGGSIRVTQLEFYSYWMQMRPGRFSRLLHGGKLLQHFITDAYACIDTNNLNYIRTHQKELRAEYYSGIVDRVGQGGLISAREIGKKIILPSSYHGGPRAM